MSSCQLPRSSRVARLTSLSLPGVLALLSAPGAAQIVGGRLVTHTTLPSGGAAAIAVGDLDRDGTQDYAVGAAFIWAAPSTVTVYSGRTGQKLREFSQSSPGNRFGASLGRAGDVNRDGSPDVLIGAPYGGGAAYVYSLVDGQLIRQYQGPAGLGTTVDVVGDLDGDGVLDHLLSAPEASPGGRQGAGTVFVCSGATGRILHAFNGPVAGARFANGRAAFDADGDGTMDIVLTEGSTTSSCCGFAFAGTGVRVYSGRTFDELWSVVGSGFAVGVGDVNRDRFEDIARGYSQTGAGLSSGEVVVYSGQDGRVIHHIQGSIGEYLGRAVGYTGDVNRDGYDDIGAVTSSGTVVFSGRDGSRLLERRGSNTASISSAGDFNGDRFLDVLVTEELGETAIFGVEPFMVPSSFGMNALQGATVDYDIDFPDGAGNQNYMVLMSASGTGPFTFGVEIPLTIDPFLVASALGHLAALQTGFAGTLSSTGTATASLILPPGQLSFLSGGELNLAAIAFPTGGLAAFSSSAIRLTIR